ncbi:MAG: lysine--tRNA ligase [Simkaniaceae bacterium]|nr:lysine--tRNA ligase [Simkaniaceae bacterium]
MIEKICTEDKTMAPEYHDYDEFKSRRAKLDEIREMGVEPYPHKFEPTASPGELRENFDETEVGSFDDAELGDTLKVTVSGRLVLFRAMGKNAFGQVQDQSGRVQVMFNRDLTLVEGLNTEMIKPIKFIEKKIDLGDIIGIEGHLFKTQKGELTIYAKKVTLLCKTLLPLPDKHAGLVDKGMRYKKRWLDLISNEEVMKTFEMRSKITRYVREYLTELEFLEVETPVLQNAYGGAEADPFITEINALHQQMFMRIALEIPLKKLIIGGMQRIFEIGKVFRNEGLDKTHNPEFTMLEMYAANWDYRDVMECTENLFANIAERLFGTTVLEGRKDKNGVEHDIDLTTPWKRMSMKEATKVYGNFDVDAMSDEEMRAALVDGSDFEKEDVVTMARGKLIACMFEEFAEAHLIQPHHIIDHPIETTPLCKLHRDPALKKERFVERFETFILGMEFCNAYSELNDPVLQRELLENQANARGEEAVPMDEEFVEAICQGMPPTGGLGIGMDRLTMLFTGETSIRDVLFFPIMRD